MRFNSENYFKLYENIKIYEDKIEIINYFNDIEECNIEEYIYSTNSLKNHKEDDESENISKNLDVFFEDSKYMFLKEVDDFFIFYFIFKDENEVDVDEAYLKVYLNEIKDKIIFEDFLVKKEILKNDDWSNFSFESFNKENSLEKTEINENISSKIIENKFSSINYLNNIKDNSNFKTINENIKGFDENNNLNEMIFLLDKIDLKEIISLKFPKINSCVVFYESNIKFEKLRNDNYFNKENYNQNYLQTDEGEDIDEYLKLENFFYMIQPLNKKEINKLKNSFKTYIDKFIYKFYTPKYFENLKKNLINNKILITDKTKDIKLFEEIINEFLFLNYDFNLFYELLLEFQNIFILSYNKIKNTYNDLKIKNFNLEDNLLLTLIKFKLHQIHEIYEQFLQITTYDIINNDYELIKKFKEKYLYKIALDFEDASIYSIKTIVNQNLNDFDKIIKSIKKEIN